MAPSASLTNSTMSCCGCLLGSFVMTSMSSRPCVKSWYNCFFRSSFKLAVREGFNLVQVRLGSAAISQLQNVSSFALCQLSSHLSNQLSAQLSAQLHPVTSYALCHLSYKLLAELWSVSYFVVCELGCSLSAHLFFVLHSYLLVRLQVVSLAVICRVCHTSAQVQSVSSAACFPAQLWYVSLAAIWQVSSNAEVSALILYISCLQKLPWKTKAAFLVAMIKVKIHAVTVRCIYNLKSTLCLGRMSSLLHDIHDTIYADSSTDTIYADSSTADGYSWCRGWAELGSLKHQDGCLQCCTCAVHMSHWAFAVQKTKCCVRAEQI